jgi:HD-like signal output (HDOD) protein
MLDHSIVVQRAYQLQPLPQSCTRLAALVAQDDPDLKAITEVISFDPVMTAKLLRVANSVLFPGRRVGSVKEAVIRLGANTVFGLAVAACAESVLDQAVPGYALSAGKLWWHSTTAALAAELAKGYCRVIWPSMAFTAALLHDLGKLVLGRCLTPELVALCQGAAAEGNLAPYQAEAEILSVHHGEVSGIIAQYWNLPPEIVRGVTHHHTPEEGNDTICFTTHLANAVAHHIEGNSARSRSEVETLNATLDRLALTRAGFEKLAGAVAQRLDEDSRQFI